MQTITTNSNGNAIAWRGGIGTFIANGTFGGGTLKMQFIPRTLDSSVNANWSDVPSASFTASSMINFTLPAGFVRPVLSGATSPSIVTDFGACLGVEADRRE